MTEHPQGLDDLLNYVADNLPDPGLEEARCSEAVMKRSHLPHGWEVQPGYTVRCPGVPFAEEPEAQTIGSLLGLTEEEIGWLHTAFIACERLNASLEKNRSAHRWHVLGDSDKRRTKKEK